MPNIISNIAGFVFGGIFGAAIALFIVVILTGLCGVKSKKATKIIFILVTLTIGVCMAVDFELGGKIIFIWVILIFLFAVLGMLYKFVSSIPRPKSLESEYKNSIWNYLNVAFYVALIVLISLSIFRDINSGNAILSEEEMHYYVQDAWFQIFSCALFLVWGIFNPFLKLSDGFLLKTKSTGKQPVLAEDDAVEHKTKQRTFWIKVAICLAALILFFVENGFSVFFFGFSFAKVNSSGIVWLFYNEYHLLDNKAKRISYFKYS